MNLLIAVVQDQDVNRLLTALLEKGYRATKLASTGGFLRQGNTTLLIGVKEEEVKEVNAIIKEICRTRKGLVSPMPALDQTLNTYIPTPIEVEVGGATVFTLKVESFEKM
ncbi:MAG TPA: hypothetical protein GXZ98_06805 [Firmicutes bacterium]|jgi:uncharacterized protein YaaQ|nr:hypothetical protein [Bacillota bacterium]